MATEEALRDYLKLVTADLAATKQRLRDVEAGSREPIAIVGIACRFPGGVRGPEDLWRLVSSGTDAIAEFPDDRGWDLEHLYHPDPDHPGTSYVAEGGFVDSADRFDAAFFGISPREALGMDPQQRMLLQTSWEAIEHAGIDPAGLRGHQIGVFVATSGQDYVTVLQQSPDSTEGYIITGTAASVVSGRISYALGLEGPAVTVDTACSSSLVALHLATQALRNGECTLALTGGSTIMCSPAAFIGFSRQRGLAPDGRCKPFAAGADGTGWGEGAGVLLLERLSDAQRNGHPVLAVVRGSAVNQDGASNGLTAPNGPSQQRVILQALTNAQLSPHQIDIVETHGSGTPLGDTIEAQALLATYGQSRPADRPLRVGSVKSNIGHCQAAAGVAGVIKTVMSMRNGLFPKLLNVDEPSPDIDWSTGALALPLQAEAWPRRDEPRRAGVSSFGMSGTNAHVLLEEAPAAPVEDADGAEPPLVPIVLSARDHEGVARQARKLAAWLGTDESRRLADTGLSAVVSRSTFEHRAVVLAADRADALRALDALAAGEPSADVVSGNGTAGATTAPLAFMFSGQGGQRPGMGRELAAAYPAFDRALDEVCALLDPHLPRPLKPVVFAAEGTAEAELLDRTRYTQAALFAVEVALAALVRGWGLRPDHVVGHSFGEIAAAHVAGVLSLADACVLVAARGRLMEQLPGGGAMLAIGAPEADVAPTLEPFGGRVVIAAVNGPAAVVVSGEAGPVAEVKALWAAREVRTKLLRISTASHSPLMDPMLDEFGRIAAGLTYNPPAVPFMSTVTGAPVTEFDAAYWVGNVRRAVRFADAVTALADLGVTALVELGPDGILAPMAENTLGERPGEVLVVPVLRRDRPEPHAALTALAQLHVRGRTVDWAALFAGTGARRVPLPTYAFAEQRFWPRPGQPPATGGDGEFWAAVERGEVQQLATGPELESLESALPVLDRWRRSRSERSELDAWSYLIKWKPVEVPERAAPGGPWVVLVPRADAPQWTGDVLATLGDAVALEYGEEDLDRARLAARVTGAAGVILVAAGQDRPVAGHPGSSIGSAAALALTQALDDLGGPARLWCLTSGAVSVGPADPVEHPLQALVWGLGRAAALEYPQWWGGLIDLPATIDRHGLRRLPGILAGGEDQVALRGSGAYGRRLLPAPPGGAAERPWQPSGTVLVTGGTGALGAQLAHWLLDRGAERVVLVSRRGAGAPGAAELAREAGVEIVACDVTDRDAVAALVAGLPGLTAIVHAAGVDQLAAMTDTTLADFAAVTAAKVLGALNLDAAVGDRPLDAFVLYSSISAIWGSAGQCAYGASNSVLDALAQHRRARGLAGTAVAWTAWGGRDGMAAKTPAAQAMQRLGVPPVPPERLLAALDRVLQRPHACMTVADVDWSRFYPSFSLSRPSPLLADLPAVLALTEAAEEDSAGAAGGAIPSSLAHLSALSADERRRALLDLVGAQTAVVLGHGVGEDLRDRPFKELGFDSLTAVEFRNKLNDVTGLRLPSTLVFDYPTPIVLADHLHERVFGGASAAAGPDPSASPADDPIAIVGMACRYPGGITSPEDLWRIVADGVDAIGAFPADRGWAAAEGAGGFLDDVAGFDAAFFGISPREALAMDPQQRLLLEAAWEVFERAGIDVHGVRGRQVGVFVGASGSGYGSGLTQVPEGVEGYLMTGGSGSVISGRVAYAFGLEGPAVTVDTACSSSLVALHLAAQALRNGECELAIAGGVAVLATPNTFAEFSRQGGLAGDGRCKAFAASADGTGWSEGVGLLLVQRLSAARRDGRQVLAIVRGSAVNQDGASNGLTAPNGPSQQRVIRAALAAAGLGTNDVDLIEAHGTGTVLGDPIEAQALLATYGQDRESPLWLGSVKSNLGHPQAAAGVAGIIKTVMAIRHGVLPKTLHVDEPTPHVDWTAGAVSLLTEARPWEATRPRRAAVSSFGISGTNAHTIIEEDVLEPVAAGPVPGSPVAVLLSARDAASLTAQAARWSAFVAEHPDLRPADLAYSSAVARAALERRAVVVAPDRQTLADGLDALAAGREHPAVATGTAAARPGVAFLFPGQGAQRLGMGAELAREHPVFATAFDAVCTHFDQLLPRPLASVMHGDADGLDQTRYTQAALFAFEVALFRLLEHLGLRPDHLAGHSIGEISAAHVAGVLGLPDACLLVDTRSRLMQDLPAGGAMLSVAGPVEDLPDGVSVAAVNGPGSIVLSGPAELIDTLPGKRLRVSHAFHSALMEPMLEPFREVLRTITFHPPQIPIVSTVTGAPITAFDADYWVTQVRDTVRFADAVTCLHSLGARAFVELGPAAVLSALVPHPDALAVPLGRAGRPETAELLAALGRLHVAGVPVAWPRLFEGTGAVRVDVPTYAFQRERYWMQDAPNGTADITTTGLDSTGHPILGAATELPEGEGTLFTGRISLRTHPWLADHAVMDTILIPGTAFVELASWCGRRVGAPRVADLTLEQPLVLPRTGGVDLQARVGAPDPSGGRPVAIYSRSDAPGDDPEARQWQRHATGLLTADSGTPAYLAGQWPPAGAHALVVDDIYPRLATQGYQYGPSFQALRAAWRLGREVFAEVVLPASVVADARAFGLHPALMDAAMHALGAPAAVASDEPPAEPGLPFSWNGVAVHATGVSELRVRLTPSDGGGLAIAMADTTGAPVASVAELVLRPVKAGQLSTGSRSLFRPEWIPVPTEPGARGDAVIHTATGAVGDAVADTHRRVHEMLARVQAFLADEDGVLAVVTRGAVPVADGDTVTDLSAAALWGMLGSAQSENPGRIVLADLDDAPESEAALPAALAGGEPQIAIRAGQVYAARLARPAEAPADEPPALGDGTVLVTGATGALGRLMARHLVTAHGVRRLLLLSRSGPDAPGAASLVAELEALGASVDLAACDVADHAELARTVAGHPLVGVVHMAGVLDDGVLGSQTPQRYDTVLRPKVDAAWNLHRVTEHLPLRAFVLFSSAAAILGGPGQSNYAAGNAFLNGLAHYRRARGLPGTSIAWGPWSGTGGMTGHLADADARRMSRGGLTPFAPDEGLALFSEALRRPEPVLAPLRLNQTAFKNAGAAEVPPVLRSLIPTAGPGAAPRGGADDPAAALRAALTGLDGPERTRMLADLVRTQAAAVLGFASMRSIDEDRGFLELGFDSLMAVEFRNRLNAVTGLRLPSTLIFDRPTSAALADYLASTLVAEKAVSAFAILGELTRIEASMDAVPLDDTHRAVVGSRLRDLLARWTTPEAASGDLALQTASAEELFTFLDDELGAV
ncbi:type I polyketide synthase [Dactylosporangium sp. CA-052675]|uniref:type I polyketide synthase n=1 Tax=Dactylosporangium sp. CA-052675 TaxID=3239927 RepID=UPI003D9488CF